jgi:sugar phosphate isomerase/epimerase
MTTISSFGFKIVERSRSEIETLVERALNDRLPLEVGLYFGDREALDFLATQLQGEGLRLAVHLDHRQLSVFDLHSRERLMREQLATAARLEAQYVITHLSPYPMTRRPEHREAMLDKLYADLRFTARICAEHGLDVHIENTYEDLDFYRRLFRGLGASGIEGVHFCFDLGHAKVWSSDRLVEWLGFLEDLVNEELRLHFHLHANRGLSDEHLSFVSAERLGITDPDCYTSGVDYFQSLAQIAERFPGANKVFEVPAQEAEENLGLVLGRIVEARSFCQPLLLANRSAS